jgi:RNA polymerase sigma-70 factor (ECF subfamily)
MTSNAALFSATRSHLFGIAYRMLGSKADAEDVLQDAWLRWHEQDASVVRSPQAWLTTTVARLSIDRLRAAKVQRAAYSGPWLPEPLPESDLETPESHVELASDLSVAFLAMLERLGPEERAAFVLREVFECEYDDIGETLGKTPAACRQLVHRARDRITMERRRFNVDEQTRRRMFERFIAAANRGEYYAVKELFADDATLTSDGGGKAIAVIRVLHGAARIARLWYAVARRRRLTERRFVRVNGQLGIANYVRGRLHSVSTIDTDGERIYAYYSIANPDKLGAYVRNVGGMAVTGGGARASG